jgi:hypothetical protein
MGFWFAIFLLVATTVVSALMQKHPKDAQPAGRGDFSIPTAEAGRPIPVIFGTIKMGGPNVTWWGDLTVQAIKVKSGGFLGIGEKKVTTGYQYFAGMMLALCHGPVDAVKQVLVADKDMGATQVVVGAPENYTQLSINNPGAFGGNEGEGGISGLVSFYRGLQTQLSDSYLTAQWGAVAPAFRGLCYAVMNHCYVGNSQYLKNWSFVIQRCPNTLGLSGGKHLISPAPIWNAFAGTGNGILTLVALGGTPVTDAFTITATDATHFTVIRKSDGVSLGTATVGTTFSHAQVVFKINTGTIAFIAGDAFLIQTDGGIDANPACCIYEIMTSTDYGLGIPTARFDIASFQACGNTLATEKFGVSFNLDQNQTADSVLGDLCRTIDAVLFTDPATGLWTMKLVRADYVVSGLQTFTIDNLQDAPKFTRGAWSETINEAKVEFICRAQGFVNQICQAQESANYAVRGEMASESFTYHAISNPTTAQAIAFRELKTHSYPLARFTLKLDRTAWVLRPGSVFKLTWVPPTGPSFTDLVVRAIAIRYGDLGNPQIEVDCCEDIFSVAAAAYSPPGGSGWTDPLTAPAVVSAAFLFEAPYHLVGQTIWAVMVAARGDQTSFGAEVWVDEGSGYFLSGGKLTNFTPSGVLLSAYGARTAANDPVGFTIASGAMDMSRLVPETTDAAGLLRGDNLAIFADTGEIVSWTTCTDNGDGTFTFSGNLRGVLDTVPADHSIAARVYFFSDGSCTTKDAAYAAVGLVTAKPLPKNARGTVSLAAASAVTMTTMNRASAPYPPGNVQVNALGYVAWPTTTIGDAVFTWSHRNRLTQGIGGAMVPQDTAGSFTLEAGSYTVEILVNGVVKQTYSGLTGLTQTYPASQRILDDPIGSNFVTMRVKPINGALTGTIRTTPPFTMTGLGMTLGNTLGGVQA